MIIKPREKLSEADDEPNLTPMDRVMRRIALLACLVSIFFFFFKILFF